MSKIGKMKSLILSIYGLCDPKTKRFFVISALTGVLVFLLESFFVFVFQYFLYSFGIGESFAGEWNEKIAATGVNATVLLMVYGVLRGLVLFAKNFSMRMAQQAFLLSQRQLLTHTFLNRNAASLDINNVTSVFTERLTALSEMIFSLARGVTAAVASGFFVIYCLYNNPFEMVVGSIGLCLFFIPVSVFGKKIGQSGDAITREWTFVNGSIMASMRNFFFIKVYALEKFTEIRLRKWLENYYEHYKKYLVFSTAVEVLPIIAGVVVVAVVAHLSVNVNGTPIAQLLGFLYVFLRLSQSLSEASVAFSSMLVQKAAIENINVLSAGKSFASLGEKLVSQSEPPRRDTVEFKDFAVGHAGKVFFTIDSLKLRPGDIVLIKGKSGSGKSTWIATLMGLHHPMHGEAQILGFDAVREKAKVAPFVGYVGPDPFLFAGTLKENLILNNEDNLSDRDVQNLLESVQLHSLVDKLHENINDVPQFSTGQLQRISLARALLRQPKLLVLDEFTANLDATTEAQVLGLIQNLSRDRITIVVSHKDSFDAIGSLLLDFDAKSIRRLRDNH